MLVVVGTGESHENREAIHETGQWVVFTHPALNRQPPTGVNENDDVSPAQLERTAVELRHNDPVIPNQGLLHRVGGNKERPNEERLDQEGHHECRDHNDDGVAKEYPQHAPHRALLLSHEP